MQLDNYTDIDDPREQLKTEDYLKWFLANDWHIQKAEYNGETYPALVKTQPTPVVDVKILKAASELCAHKLQITQTEKYSHKVKIITGMTVEGFC